MCVFLNQDLLSPGASQGRAKLPPCRVRCTFFNTRAFPKLKRRLSGGGFTPARHFSASEMLSLNGKALTLMALKRSSPWRKWLQQASQLQLLQKSPLAKQSQYLWGQSHSLSQAMAESKPFPGNVH